jgi:methionyl aminopeptidase
VPTSIAWPDYAISSVSESERQDKNSNSKIRVYTDVEIANIREACRIGRLALDTVGEAIKAGVTTDEVYMLHIDTKANICT